MSLEGDDEGGWSTANLLALMRGLRSPVQLPDDPIAQLKSVLAQDTRRPRNGGLFGSGYADYMADRGTPAYGASGAEPETWGAHPAAFGGPVDDAQSGVARPVVLAAAQPRVVNAETGAPYSDAQEATFGGMIDRGELDPRALPGSRGFPRGMPDAAAQPQPGQWYVDLDGRLQQAPGAVAQAPPSPADTQASGAYQSARREGRGLTTVYVRPDGTEDVYQGGSMAWRNNNPGNLKDGAFARRHGAIGGYTNDKGTFAIFPDAATGESARQALLKGPSYSDLTLDGFVAKYAPKNENDTAKYQAQMRQALGVDGSTRLRDLRDEQWGELFAAVRRKEGAIPGRVSTRAAPQR
jgi:hypothetical protein